MKTKYSTDCHPSPLHPSQDTLTPKSSFTVVKGKGYKSRNDSQISDSKTATLKTYDFSTEAYATREARKFENAYSKYVTAQNQ